MGTGVAEGETQVQESTAVEDPVFIPSDWHLLDVIPLHQIVLPVVPLRLQNRRTMSQRLQDVLEATRRLGTNDLRRLEGSARLCLPTAVRLDLQIARPPWEVDDAEFMCGLLDACHRRLSEARSQYGMIYAYIERERAQTTQPCTSSHLMERKQLFVRRESSLAKRGDVLRACYYRHPAKKPFLS